MAEKFVGKWKLESTENFDEYMKAVGKYGTSPGRFRNVGLSRVIRYISGVYFQKTGPTFLLAAANPGTSETVDLIFNGVRGGIAPELRLYRDDWVVVGSVEGRWDGGDLMGMLVMIVVI